MIVILGIEALKKCVVMIGCFTADVIADDSCRDAAKNFTLVLDIGGLVLDPLPAKTLP